MMKISFIFIIAAKNVIVFNCEFTKKYESKNFGIPMSYGGCHLFLKLPIIQSQWLRWSLLLNWWKVKWLLHKLNFVFIILVLIQTFNLPEQALQHVSMLFRSEPFWEVIEPLKEIGWRIRRNYFLVRPKDQPKVRQVLAWVSMSSIRFGDPKLSPHKSWDVVLAIHISKRLH